MACYVDTLTDYGGWFNKRFGPSCHLLADTLEELHDIAAKVGMKRSWFQKGGRMEMPHYDLVANRRKRAVTLGAIEIDRKELYEMMKDYERKNAV